ncbi:hypothetical protein NEAUS06_0010 [Nematocida ausubeli]|nr:hypothetical protein NEAUS06_0010 [Nematocida ausubeli]
MHRKKELQTNIIMFCVGCILMCGCRISSALSLEEIDKIHAVRIPFGYASKAAINPKGPLCPLYPFYIDRARVLLLYYKETQARLQAEKNSKMYRAGKKDCNACLKKYIVCSGGVKESVTDYLDRCSQVFLEVFRLKKDGTEVELNESSKFYKFLASSAMQEYKDIVIAAFFLLSEGVPVHLYMKKSASDRTEKVLLIKRERSIKDKLCKVPMDLESGLLPYTKEVERVSGIFTYYNNIRHCICKKHLKEPKTFNSFTEEHFLRSPRFLIRMYIYKFYDNLENLTVFYSAVMHILSQRIMDKYSTRISEAQSACKKKNPELEIEDPFKILLGQAYKVKEKFDMEHKKVINEVKNQNNTANK